MVLQNLIPFIRQHKRIVLIHLLVWAIFILYEVSFVYLTQGKTQGFINTFLAYLKNALLFYTNIWCLEFCFTRKQRTYLYLILLIAEFAGYIVVHCFVTELPAGWKLPLSFLLSKIFILQYIYRAIYFIGLSSAYWLMLLSLRNNKLISKMQGRHLIQQKRSIELERNLFKARNAYLTSQINPHLLFNTLNFIYSSLYEVSKQAAETVVLLSDMMRYSLTEIGEDGQVELSREVEHIENMVQLNQARFNGNLNIKMYMNGDFEVKVIPLVFLTFVENIFKHGDLSDPGNPAQINISYFNNIVEYYSSNKIRKVNINRGTGIGVENSKTRLDMAYADKYTLTTQVEGEQYITRLVINFN